MEISERMQQDYSIRIGDYISKGWQVFSGNMGGFIAYFVLVGLISMGLSFIPVLGSLALMVLSGALQAGLYIVAFRRMKGATPEFGEFFNGFKYLLPLFLYTLVSGILIVLGFILLIIPGIYLSVSYMFAIPLILDRRLDFWQAMETSRKVVGKKWFSIFGFVIVLGLINVLGALALLIGLLFTGPLTICAWAVAYDDIFGLESTEFEGA